jgi:hypothetical protein
MSRHLEQIETTTELQRSYKLIETEEIDKAILTRHFGISLIEFIE